MATTGTIVVTINVPLTELRPNATMGQILREIAPIVENMNPLATFTYPHRVTQQTRAAWTIAIT